MAYDEYSDARVVSDVACTVTEHLPWLARREATSGPAVFATIPPHRGTSNGVALPVREGPHPLASEARHPDEVMLTSQEGSSIPPVTATVDAHTACEVRTVG